MIDRSCLHRNTQAAAAKVRKFIYVCFEGKPDLLCHIQDSLSLLYIKCILLAKHVHKKWNSAIETRSFVPLPGAWQHLITNECDIFVTSIFILWRDGMRGQKRWNNIDGMRT